MTQVLIPILVAVIGALGTIAAAVIPEIMRQPRKTSESVS